MFEESLRWLSEFGWKEGVAYDLVGLAAAATEANDPERAARLLGQVESLVEEMHLELAQYSSVIRGQTQEQLQSILQPGRFAPCFEEGRSTPFEDIVSLVLSDVG